MRVGSQVRSTVVWLSVVIFGLVITGISHTAPD